jgi:hypothetical protein
MARFLGGWGANLYHDLPTFASQSMHRLAAVDSDRVAVKSDRVSEFRLSVALSPKAKGLLIRVRFGAARSLAAKDLARHETRTMQLHG